MHWPTMSPHLQDGDIDGVHAPSSAHDMNHTHIFLCIRILYLYQGSHWIPSLPVAPIPGLPFNFPTHMTKN